MAKKLIWTEDHCPECGNKAIMACKCPLNDRKCVNGHCWRRVGEDNKAVMLTDIHGEPREKNPTD